MKYNTHEIMDFNANSFINKHGYTIKYVHTINNKPMYVQYIDGIYNEYDNYDDNIDRFYAFSMHQLKIIQEVLDVQMSLLSDLLNNENIITLTVLI